MTPLVQEMIHADCLLRVQAMGIRWQGAKIAELHNKIEAILAMTPDEYKAMYEKRQEVLTVLDSTVTGGSP